MKNLLCLLWLFTVSSVSFAQPQELLDNDWYLHQLIIDEVTYIPYGTNLSFFVDFYEDNPGEFFLYYEGLGLNTARIEYSTNDPLFTVLEFFSLTDHNCVNKACIIFASKYGEFYFIENGIYEYEITANGNGTETLVVNSPNGDQAIYSTAVLGIGDRNTPTFVIFPNPTQDVLYISSEGAVIEQISVYNTMGQKVLEPTIVDNSMDVSALQKGIYFIAITLDNERVFQKFIKI